MKEKFLLSFVLIIVHENICKKYFSLHANYFSYVQICVNVTEDGLSIV